MEVDWNYYVYGLNTDFYEWRKIEDCRCKDFRIFQPSAQCKYILNNTKEMYEYSGCVSAVSMLNIKYKRLV